ncbi:MAG TPA: LysR substrate-binding domain-containing protein [Burkholderiaceae bacterium]|jgi:DNA-binding transcriptional LysR family regulator
MNPHIDLRHLRYFLAVAEELNVGRAAERLHISQPPLTRQIRQLESELGVDLFMRSRAGMALTAAGEALLPEVRKTMTQVERALAIAQTAGNAAERQFVIGYTTVFDQSAIPDVREYFRQHFPNVRFVVKGKHSINLVKEIKNGMMDMAFIGLHTDPQDLQIEVISEQPFVVALPAPHSLARKRSISFADLRSERLFWFERRINPGFYDYCQKYFSTIGFRPEIISEPADHHVLLGLIAEGRGIALLPESLMNVKRKGVVFRPLRDASGFSMGIAVAYDKANTSPLLRRLLHLIRTESRKNSM